MWELQKDLVDIVPNNAVRDTGQTMMQLYQHKLLPIAEAS